MIRRSSIPLLAALAASAALAAPASASVSSVLAGSTVTPGLGVPCAAQASDGVVVCHGSDEAPPGVTNDSRYKSVIGSATTPLEIYVILPPGADPNGHYPLIVQSHGWGGQAGGPDDTQFLGPTADTLAKDGYAVLQLTARGFKDSCGKLQPPAVSYDPAACGTNSYIRLDDDRYEVRDVQNAVGDLVDAGLADPAKIGVTGESYGGGVSLQLATLRNRIMNPDGSLAPWSSPHGTPLSIAAAAPTIPWSDLAYSLAPNGHNVDEGVVGPNVDESPLGVPKQSFVSGLFALGSLSGNYAVPGSDPQADLTTWFGEINSPANSSDPNISTLLDTIQHYHSAYYLLDGKYHYPTVAPPPLLIANGFTDDLFPVDEALRYRNLEASLYPGDPIYLYDWDGGHQRGQNKSADNTRLVNYVQSFFDLYLKGSAGASPGWGSGATPPAFTALTQTCPSSAASGGPFTGASWAELHPGQVTYTTTAPQTVSPNGGSASVAQAFDPITGPGACATAPAADQGSGVASYRLPAASGGGYTLLGSPLVALVLKGTTPPTAQLALRLLDVNPQANTETLVARQLYRPAGDGFQLLQLHPGAWHFAAGHIAKLEVLGSDNPYGQSSSSSASITVSALGLSVPVHEAPGTTVISGGSGTGTTTTVVTKPTAITPATLAPPCRRFSPSVRLRTRASNVHGIVLRGTAAETPCRHPTADQRRRGRVTRVRVAISRGAGHGRCRFLAANGRLTHARRCRSPLYLRAGGTTRWQFRIHLRHRLPRGSYGVVVAVQDGYGHTTVTRTTLRMA